MCELLNGRDLTREVVMDVTPMQLKDSGLPLMGSHLPARALAWLPVPGHSAASPTLSSLLAAKNDLCFELGFVFTVCVCACTCVKPPY